MSSGPRLRFAPSPTGFFHVGGARTALYNWALAQRLEGTFVLRIEDTDEARNRPEWTQGIIDALAWIGVRDTDPAFEGPYFQSQYAAAHLAAAQRLFEAGNAYYCDLTSEQIQERAKAAGASGYDGYSRDRGLGPGPGRVLRFRVPDGATTVHDLVRGDVDFDHTTIEDFVLLRGNGTPMFLLANVVDDIEMRISHVVRAEEHLPNTPKQQMLWEALGHQPPVWAHVPLLVNEQRKKLSKRRDKVAVEQYREEGYLPEAMVNYLMTLGWSPPGDQEIVPWSIIESAFRLEDVNHSPAFFDIKKLNAFNGEYIRMLSVEDFIAACQPFLHGADVPWPAERFDPAKFAALASVVQSRATTLSEVPGVIDFVFLADPELDQAAWDKTMATPGAKEVLLETTEAYRQLPHWGAAALKETLEEIGEQHGLKKGKAQAPIRVAVTGRSIGPPLFEALKVLGREEVVRRLTVVAPGVSEFDPLMENTPATGTSALAVADPTPVGGVQIVRRRRWPRRLAVGAAAMVLLTLVYYGVTFLQVRSTGLSDQVRTVDAIVVMGAAQYDGRPSPQLAARLDHAADLWASGLAEVLVVTGGNQPGDRFTEAEASANYLVDRGVPAEAILQEDASHSTYESLEAVSALLHQRGLFSVLLVSDPFHSLRTRLTAEELGLVAYVSPTRTSPVRGSTETAREFEEAAGIALGRIIGFKRLLSITG